MVIFSTTAHAYAASWSPLFRQACGVCVSECVCSFGRRQKSSTLGQTLANECHHLELCLLADEEQQLRQHIETIVHAQAVGLFPGSGDSSQNVAGVSSTEPRATAWTLCASVYTIHRVWALDLLPLAHTNYLYHQWLAHGYS
jgi:hypothetical protein